MRFIVRERQAAYVDSFYAVEAADADEAAKVVQGLGAYTYLGFNLDDNVESVSSEIVNVEPMPEGAPKMDYQSTTPKLTVYVTGGVVQGVRSSGPVNVAVFDTDNDMDDEEFAAREAKYFSLPFAAY